MTLSPQQTAFLGPPEPILAWSEAQQQTTVRQALHTPNAQKNEISI